MLALALETSKLVQEQEWARLIALTAQGDQNALATLYDRTSPQVFGLILKILNNREAAEEVTLDVYAQYGARPIPMTKPVEHLVPG